MEPQITVETVTPEVAAAWLIGNVHNRNSKATAIAKYVADMAAGRWDLNGESIKFNGDGRLLDGQNRLMAVVESGATIRTVVVRGIDASGQETIDVGVPRGLADVLKLRGEVNCTELAAGLTALWRYQRDPGNMGTTDSPSRHQALALLDSHPGIRESVRAAGPVRSAIGFRASVAVALHYLTTSIDEDDAALFWERLTNGDGLASDSPILALRNTIVADRGKFNQQLPRTKLWALSAKAWNAYREGRPVRLLKWSPGGANPERTPVLL